MKLEDFRQCTLAIGAELALSGDYNAESAWGENKIIAATISQYLIVKRHDRAILHLRDNNLDTAVIAERELASPIQGIDSIFSGKYLILLLRNPSDNWDHSDPNVHIFGLSAHYDLSQISINDAWHEHAVWLSAGAIMGIISEGQESAMGAIFANYERV